MGSLKAEIAEFEKAINRLAHQNKRSFINPLKIGYSEYPIFSLKTETYLNALFI